MSHWAQTTDPEDMARFYLHLLKMLVELLIYSMATPGRREYWKYGLIGYLPILITHPQQEGFPSVSPICRARWVLRHFHPPARTTRYYQQQRRVTTVRLLCTMGLDHRGLVGRIYLSAMLVFDLCRGHWL